MIAGPRAPGHRILLIRLTPCDDRLRRSIGLGVGNPGRGGVTSHWTRFSFRIKHQLYLRILPVVAVSVLAVGAFSGRLLTSRAARTYVEQESQAHDAALESALANLGVRALAAEVRKKGDLSRQMATAAPGQRGALAARFLDSFAQTDGVRGAAFVEMPGARLLAQLEEGMDTPANHAALAAWAGSAWSGYASADWVDRLARSGWEGGPRLSPADDARALWIFDPLALRAADDTTRLEMVLPVALHEDDLWRTPRGAATAHPAGTSMHVVLLLDVNALLADWLREPGRRFAADARGRLLAANIDTLPAGLAMTEPGRRVFPGVDGPALGRFLAQPAAADAAHASLGSRLNPHVFVAARRPELPLVLVSSLELSEVNGGLVLYASIIALMVAIALLGSILAITTVGEKLSNRLRAMAHNMEEVAKGDFSRRMGLGAEDEVGRLISYFNQMTADLQEANRQLSDKTQNLRLALDKMKRLDRAKDDFLSLVSHEVRTPLTAIIGGIDFLRVTMPPAGSAERRVIEQCGMLDIIEIVESSGRRLSEFMNDAILMASLQSSDIHAQLKPAPLRDMCEMALSAQQEAVRAKRLAVSNELPEDADWCVLCDRDLLGLALSKLLCNAVQHNVPDGRVRVALVDEIPGLGPVADVVDERSRREFLDQPALDRWRDAGVAWRGVLIYNTGPVIPLDRREALFQKFELVGRIEHHQKGSGLSLPIVQAILENHGGKIHVESSREAGNCFYLIIPSVPAPRAPKELAMPAEWSPPQEWVRMEEEETASAALLAGAGRPGSGQ